MKISLKLVFIFLSALPFAGYSQAIDSRKNNWAVFYGEVSDVAKFSPFSLVILEPDKNPPIKLFKERGKLVYAYLSIGEINKTRAYFSEFEKLGVLLKPNPDWPDNYMIDARNPLWGKFLIEEIIPQIHQQGYDGLMFDTADSLEYLEASDPEKYKGMKQAAVDLIAAIKMNYPELSLILNRGFSIAPDVVHNLDFILLESVLVQHDLKTRKSQYFPPEVYQEFVEKTKILKELNPSLQILALDYWNPEDTKEIRNIYNKHRSNGFAPYVTTVELNEIHPPK